MKTRNTIPQETIDSLTLNEDELNEVFSNLHGINRLTRNYALFHRAFKPLISELKKLNSSEIRVVDLGCGAGQQLDKTRQLLEASGMSCVCTGLDFNPKLIAAAKTEFKAFPNLLFEVADIMAPDFNLPECDVVISSQFLYRFSDEEFLTFLQKNFTKVSTAMVVSEVNRNPIAGIFFPVVAKILGWHSTTISDGLVALHKSWTRQELMALLSSSGMFGHIESRSIPFRFALTCYRKR